MTLSASAPLFNPKWRFLFVTSNSGFGASEELWIQAAHELQLMGATVLAATGWPPNASKGTSPPTKGVAKSLHLSRLRGSAYLQKLGVPLVTIAPGPNLVNRVSARLWPEQFSASAKLNKVIRTWRPDFVLFNSSALSDSLELLGAIQKSGVPYGVVTHLVTTDHWPDDRLAERMSELFNGARQFWAVSRQNLSLLETQLGRPIRGAEIAINPFLVSGPPLPMPEMAGGETIQFAMPARLAPRTKGHDILVEVLRRPHWRNKPLRVSWFGTGGSEETLRRLVEQADLQDKIHFCGHTGEVAEIWRDHHALLLPSRHEGLPLSVVEAMWLGRVVIANPAGGVAEVVRDGDTGFLSSGFSADDFDALLSRAWEQRFEWQGIARRAAASIRSQIPENPAAHFAEALRRLAGSA